MKRARTSDVWWCCGALAVVAALGWLGTTAVRVLGRTLPCVWAGSTTLGFQWSSDLPCLSSAPVVGRQTWLVGALLATIVATGIATALTRTAVRLARTHMSVRRLLRRRVPASREIRRAAAATGIGATVVEVADTGPFAFCVGQLRLQIVVSSRLVELLEGQELLAVLAHERAHLERHDPLRRVVCRALAELMFFLPALTDVVQRIDLETELAADQLAIGLIGRRPLASALHRVLAESDGVQADGLALVGIDGVAARINSLVDGQSPGWRPAWWRIAISGMAVGVIATLLSVAGGLVDARAVPRSAPAVEVIPTSSP